MNQTALYNEHKKLGAKFLDFANFAMPLHYASGQIKEHLHTREHASLFDISHMGEFIVEGKNSCQELDYALARKVSNLEVGKSKYNFLLREDGTIIDDLLIYRLGQNKFMLVVNAALIEEDLSTLKQRLKTSSLIDKSSCIAKIDLQGPKSQQILEKAFSTNINLAYFSFQETKFKDKDLIISRTGYTGELGYELYLDNKNAVSLWQLLLSFEAVKPCGFGARDTLRLEMGYLLNGQDIKLNTTLFDLNFEKIINVNRNFIGNITNNSKHKLITLKLEGKRAARPNFEIYNKKDKVGFITSGSFAPSLGYAIALGFINRDCNEQEFLIKNNKTCLNASITSLPFYKKGTCRN